MWVAPLEMVQLSWYHSEQIQREVRSQAAHAPRVGEDHVESEVFPVATMSGLRDPSNPEIDKTKYTSCPSHGMVRHQYPSGRQRRLPQTSDTEASSCN